MLLFLNKLVPNPQGTLKFTLTKLMETFSYTPPIPIERSWMIGLTNLEVYISNFGITEETTNFEFCTDFFDEFSFIELKDELEEIVCGTKNSTEYLHNEILGPHMF